MASNFHVIGSANMTNLQNVKLLINGTQVGATLAVGWSEQHCLLQPDVRSGEIEHGFEQRPDLSGCHGFAVIQLPVGNLERL